MTETVYRHVTVRAIRGSATVIDRVFNDEDKTANASEYGNNAATRVFIWLVTGYPNRSPNKSWAVMDLNQ